MEKIRDMKNWVKNGSVSCIYDYLQSRKDCFPGSQYTVYIPCLNDFVTTIKNPEYLEQSNEQLFKWILDSNTPIKSLRQGYSLTYYALKNELGKVSGYLIEDSSTENIDAEDLSYLAMYVILHIDAVMHNHTVRCNRFLPSMEDFLYDIQTQERCVVALYRIHDLSIREEISLAEWEKKKEYVLKLLNKKNYYRLESDIFLLFFTADIIKCYNDIVHLQTKIPGNVTVLVEDIPDVTSWNNLFRLVETLRNRKVGTIGIMNRIDANDDMGILNLMGGYYEVTDINNENGGGVCARASEVNSHSFNASDFFDELQKSGLGDRE